MKQFFGTFKSTMVDVIKSTVNTCCDNYNIIKYETVNYISEIEYNLCPNDNDDKILCNFVSLKDNNYTFDIPYFSELNYYKKFYTLLYKRFASQTELFGTIAETFDGKTSSIVEKYSLDNTINALMYVLKELFICIKQIVETHKEKTLSYCILQEEPEKSYNYEEYIHNVACKVIISSGYYKDTLLMKFDKVDFVGEEREFCSYLLEN